MALFNPMSEEQRASMDSLMRNAYGHVAFSAYLPYVSDEREIIYFEGEYDEEWNTFISSHLEEIKEYCRQKYCTFTYLPGILSDSDMDEMIRYKCPWSDDHDVAVAKRVTTQELSPYVDAGNITPSLILYDPLNLDDVRRSGEYTNIYHRVSFQGGEDAALQLQWAIDNITGPEWVRKMRPEILYNRSSTEFPEEWEDRECSQLMDEIRIRVQQLRVHGVSEMAIAKLLEDGPVLSRLVITRDYRIFLPDYHNMEIEMRPLAKAIFLLYLVHPEGICFKDLIDYREELMGFYKRVTNRKDEADMEASIENIVSPLNNSINEKCSRIREAFIKHFDESVAKYYFITGARGTAKRIMLSRDLVEWECE